MLNLYANMHKSKYLATLRIYQNGIDMTLISSYINKYPDVKVLCVGDIMLDEFVYGSVGRISPEAPVPVINPKTTKEMLGGAGNVVANLCTLGCKTSFIGVIGRDYNGKKISQKLKDLGANTHLITKSDWPTIVKTRLISGSNHLLRIDREEKLTLTAKETSKFISEFTKLVKESDVVLLSDYNKGVLTTTITPILIEICNKYNKPVIIDPKGTQYQKYNNATLVKPNLKEFSEATGMTFDAKSPDFENSIKTGAKKLFNEHGIKNLIVTLSEHGMMFIPSSDINETLHIPTVAKEVYDVSGAGDTSLATLGASIGANAPIKDAMKLANRASGIVVGKSGTATVTADELQSAINQTTQSKGEWKQKEKLITLPQAIKIVSELKKQNKVIGFTNGCFDCLHAGHLSSFVQSKNNCDVLFVGMNSDASVKKLKGPTRPIQDEKTRGMLLASLEFIDYVIVFDDDTAMPIIDAIRPDVIAKEGYEIKDWPEAQRVISYGGRAITLPRLDGYSTTGLLNKINENQKQK